MNYAELELTLGEKIIFYGSMMILGIIIGWLFYDNLLWGCIIGLAFFSLKNEYIKYLLQRRNQELLLQFRDLLYSISSAASIGKSLRQSILDSRLFWSGTYDDTDFLMMELDCMATKMEKSNVQEIELLEDFSIRTGLADVEEMVSVCKICKKSGGSLQAALAKCSDIIGDKIMLEKELNTMMAQKKFEGRIVALMPFTIILVIKIVSPTYLMPLTDTSMGRLLSTISLFLLFMAWITIERVNSFEI